MEKCIREHSPHSIHGEDKCKVLVMNTDTIVIGYTWEKNALLCLIYIKKNRTSHVLQSVCIVFMGKRKGQDNLTMPTSCLDLNVNCLLICMLMFTLHTNIYFLSHLKEMSLNLSGQKHFLSLQHLTGCHLLSKVIGLVTVDQT